MMMVDMSPKYSGEPTAQALASGLATLGRYGDNYMVHAAEGETVVPREVLESNPGLKEDLFKQMTMMGIENPNRYVVGNELNSINPITGQPEFFFKKVFRAIKRVVKKVAPIAAPIIGNLIAPGIGGIIASGITTKLQGGSIGDALKSMALSYGAQALTSGIGSALQGTQAGNLLGLGQPGAGTTALGRFGTGLQEGLTTPFTAARNLFTSGSANPLQQGIFGSGFKGVLPGYQEPLEVDLEAALQSPAVTPPAAGQPTLFRNVSSTTGSDLARAARPVTSGPMSDVGGSFGYEQYTLPSGQVINRTELSQLRAGQGIQRLNIAPDAAVSGSVVPGSGGVDAGALEASVAGQEITQAAGVSPDDGRVFKIGDQSFLRTPSGQTIPLQAPPKPPAKFLGYDFPGSETLAKVADRAALPLGLAGAAYFLTPEVQEEEQKVASLSSNDPKRIAYEKWQSIEDKNSPEALAQFETWYGKPAYTSTQLATQFGANPLAGITSTGITSAAANVPTGAIGPGLGLGIAAAGGGEIVGPGTGTSDSIPAMLSDGEFVMTAKAVRNAGNGDRDLGAARMYDMMNRFERGTA